MRPTFYFYGFCFSLAWHMFWFGFMSPAASRRYAAVPTEALCLGAILKEPDFAAVHPQGRGPFLSAAESKDHAQGSYFAERIDGAAKPPTGMNAPWDGGKPFLGPKLARRHERAAESENVSFSVGNYSDTLADITFRDIRGLLEREDLGGVMEFTALVSFDGRISSLEKTVGSGDPFLDACVVRKLKNAVFKHPPAGGSRVKICFYLRESPTLQ